MKEDPVRTVLKRTRPLLVACCVLGLCIGLLSAHGGFVTLYKLALSASTILVAAALAAEIVASLGRREFGLDVLAFLSMSSALAIGEYMAAAVVALMYAGGQYLESIAEGRAKREMTALLTRAPHVAIRRRNDELEEIAVDAVAVGDRLVVRRGDIVPVDGTLEDDAVLDEAALTGEPFPVSRERGQPVLSGCANAGNLFEMRASKSAGDSTYAGIVKLVATAHDSKATMSRLADRFALGFLILALSIAGLAWLSSGSAARAVAVLVVATPCPLILAVPIAWTAGMSRAARIGLLVKGAQILERLGQIRTMVFDKTGTLTDGQPHLSEIRAEGDENRLLKLVASLDQGSSHVAAQALVSAARERGLDLVPPREVSEKPGEGVTGIVEGLRISVGGLGYIASKASGVPQPDRTDMMSAAVAIDGKFAALLFFRDALRQDAAAALAHLRRLGLSRLVLATGDRAEVARSIAADLPLDEVSADLTPQAKIDLVFEEARRAPTMMVGDGINDAPALAAAAIGLAMGSRGSAAAVEAADAVLLVDRLDRIADGIEISRDCRRIAMQSVVAGIGLSLAGMIVAALGYLQPVEGALLQEAIDVAVVLNALRALRRPQGIGDTREDAVLLTRVPDDKVSIPS